jgi:hypothetical protein
MTQETIDKAQALMGREFNYKGKNIIIARFKEVSGTNLVFFDSKNRLITNILGSEIDHFIENLFQPLDKDLHQTQVAIPQNKLVVFEPIKENETIKQTLLDTLQKVKNDKEYIPQANAVCSIVDQMIKVQKVELDLFRMVNQKK